jgi:hypothetical protein
VEARWLGGVAMASGQHSRGEVGKACGTVERADGSVASGEIFRKPHPYALT